MEMEFRLMTRKIIQILDNPECLTALCDDGTIWFYSAGRWDKLDKPIPQD